jgi:PAS domain S-box-containing protein
MKAVHSEIKLVLDSDRMTVTLLDGRGEGFRCFGLEKGDQTEGVEKEEIFPKEGTVSGKVVETGLPVIVQDIAQSDVWIDQRLLLEGMRSSLVFPLEYKGRIFGTFNLGSEKINHFSERHFPFLRQVASALSGSIENSLLLNEIKESEEKYRTVIEGILDGVCLFGIDYRFKYSNERLAEIQGYSREELIGTDFRNYLDEESRALLAERDEQRMRGLKLLSHFELNILRKDGGIRNAEISARTIRDSKGDVNIIVILKDVTDKKKMEEQLLQAEKLRAVGEMASGVAHDFNNALAAILGNTQLMLYSVQDEEFKESLKTIEKVAKDSAQTVRRLQDFTRRKVHQELYKLSVNSIVKDAIEIAKPRWRDETQSKGMSIEMVSDFEDIPPVAGSASELREVITNIVFNAIEAMPEGGRIEIRTFQRDERDYIQISDTGMGIKEEVRKKIFEPFFTTKPFSNTGLGLSMSYGIIKRMGGEIDVESKVGQGTTFTISLPICFEAMEEEVTAITPSPPPVIKKGKEARILVIDDEESVRSVLSRILTQVKHQVNVAKDGEEGIRLFHEGEFDIVLTDLGMPGMSGWDVCKAIKKISPQTPVGMITGWGMEIGEEKMKEAELDFLISKPFDFKQIVSMVAKTMESKRM